MGNTADDQPGEGRGQDAVHVGATAARPDPVPPVVAQPQGPGPAGPADPVGPVPQGQFIATAVGQPAGAKKKRKGSGIGEKDPGNDDDDSSDDEGPPALIQGITSGRPSVPAPGIDGRKVDGGGAGRGKGNDESWKLAVPASGTIDRKEYDTGVKRGKKDGEAKGRKYGKIDASVGLDKNPGLELPERRQKPGKGLPPYFNAGYKTGYAEGYVLGYNKSHDEEKAAREADREGGAKLEKSEKGQGKPARNEKIDYAKVEVPPPDHTYHGDYHRGWENGTHEGHKNGMKYGLEDSENLEYMADRYWERRKSKLDGKEKSYYDKGFVDGYTGSYGDGYFEGYRQGKVTANQRKEDTKEAEPAGKKARGGTGQPAKPKPIDFAKADVPTDGIDYENYNSGWEAGTQDGHARGEHFGRYDAKKEERHELKDGFQKGLSYANKIKQESYYNKGFVDGFRGAYEHGYDQGVRAYKADAAEKESRKKKKESGKSNESKKKDEAKIDYANATIPEDGTDAREQYNQGLADGKLKARETWYGYGYADGKDELSASFYREPGKRKRPEPGGSEDFYERGIADGYQEVYVRAYNQGHADGVEEARLEKEKKERENEEKKKNKKKDGDDKKEKDDTKIDYAKAEIPADGTAERKAYDQGLNDGKQRGRAEWRGYGLADAKNGDDPSVFRRKLPTANGVKNFYERGLAEGYLQVYEAAYAEGHKEGAAAKAQADKEKEEKKKKKKDGDEKKKEDDKDVDYAKVDIPASGTKEHTAYTTGLEDGKRIGQETWHKYGLNDGKRELSTSPGREDRTLPTVDGVTSFYERGLAEGQMQVYEDAYKRGYDEGKAQAEKDKKKTGGGDDEKKKDKGIDYSKVAVPGDDTKEREEYNRGLAEGMREGREDWFGYGEDDGEKGRPPELLRDEDKRNMPLEKNIKSFFSKGRFDGYKQVYADAYREGHAKGAAEAEAEKKKKEEKEKEKEAKKKKTEDEKKKKDDEKEKKRAEDERKRAEKEEQKRKKDEEKKQQQIKKEEEKKKREAERAARGKGGKGATAGGDAMDVEVPLRSIPEDVKDKEAYNRGYDDGKDAGMDQGKIDGNEDRENGYKRNHTRRAKRENQGNRKKDATDNERGYVRGYDDHYEIGYNAGYHRDGDDDGDQLEDGEGEEYDEEEEEDYDPDDDGVYTLDDYHGQLAVYLRLALHQMLDHPIDSLTIGPDERKIDGINRFVFHDKAKYDNKPIPIEMDVLRGAPPPRPEWTSVLGEASHVKTLRSAMARMFVAPPSAALS